MQSNTDINERLIALAEEMAADVISMPSNDASESAEESPDVARKTLRWLKNLESTDKALEDWIDDASNIESIKKLIRIFRNRLSSARKKRAEILKEDSIQDAIHASATLTLVVLEYAARVLPQHQAKLDALIAKLPREAELRMNQSARRVIETLELGMDQAAGKATSELPVYDRLAQTSQRVHATTRRLQSVEDMAQPAREESIELAREILRRLRNMKFSDKTMIEIIDTGRPEEKATLAQKLEEMLDIYKNLLFEAANITPGILDRQEIKDATDAASTFDHAIKLMAAREMPSSMAATQQIGAADAGKTKNLAAHTLDRLLKSLQSGVEMAANAIEQEQAAQQQRAEEQNQENKDSAQAASQQGNKRRGRRVRSSGGGLSKTAARRNAGDLNGDGIADNLQGIDIRKAGAPITIKPVKEKPATMPGLKADVLEAVQKLGKELRNIDKQAQNIPPVVVTKDTKISADDKGFAVRNKDDHDRQNNKPQGPRV